MSQDFPSLPSMPTAASSRAHMSPMYTHAHFKTHTLEGGRRAKHPSHPCPPAAVCKGYLPHLSCDKSMSKNSENQHWRLPVSNQPDSKMQNSHYKPTKGPWAAPFPSCLVFALPTRPQKQKVRGGRASHMVQGGGGLSLATLGTCQFWPSPKARPA